MKIYIVVHGREGDGYVVRAARFTEFEACQFLEGLARDFGYLMDAPDSAYGPEDDSWYLAVDEIEVS